MTARSSLTTGRSPGGTIRLPYLTYGRAVYLSQQNHRSYA